MIEVPGKRDCKVQVPDFLNKSKSKLAPEPERGSFQHLVCEGFGRDELRLRSEKEESLSRDLGRVRWISQGSQR